MWGPETSTVAGRLKIIGLSTVGSHASLTASQISSANSVGVSLKHSGENWYDHFVSCSAGSSFVSDLTSLAVSTALAMASSRLMPKTTSLNRSLVAK
ncbi:hypothetical protein OGATHE_001419 [Ogataea polymorpha]|uniref:Uncharacterized protein n=1 Tax=Ogataea polymorpha TaxID=460523 RepID=A0A9P8PT23_9ASCO|nr:hypothetical protein OGATHE_001419 [Ogataea polymorpha]